MSSMSFMFFGLMLIPLILFLIWLIKQDRPKNRSYIGLAILVVAVCAAVYVIVTYDMKFMIPQ